MYRDKYYPWKETMERRRSGGDHRENYTNPFDGEDQVSSADEKEEVMVEEGFKDTEVPPWAKQITLRAMLTSLVLSIVFNFIVCKLNLTTGVIPSLNVAAGLLGFAILKFWTSLLGKAGFLKQPFTRQENTVVQTCVVASSGIAFSSMFLRALLLFICFFLCFFFPSYFIVDHIRFYHF